MLAKVYVAAPWQDRARANEIAIMLVSRGFQITHDWWMYEGEEKDESHEFLQRCAELDVQGVKDADIVIVLNTQKSEGKAVEQGLAIGWKKPIICITEKGAPTSNIFYNLPCYTHVNDIDTAIAIMTNMKFCVGCRMMIPIITSKKRCDSCKSKFNNNTDLRLAALSYYSKNKQKPVCHICDMEDIRCLQIDHIDGGGCEQRRKIGGVGFYSWLKKNKYPKGFQILCANHNWIKRYENGEHDKRS